MQISKNLEEGLRGIYEDCLELEKKGDLTEFGKGELSLLRRIYPR